MSPPKKRSRMYSHEQLVIRACRWVRRKHGCMPVFAEFNHKALDEMPDVIGWATSGYVHVIEAKVSRADFRRDAKKPHVRSGNSMGNCRWYVAPKGLISPDEIGDLTGLLEPSGRGLRVVKAGCTRPVSVRGREAQHSILRNALARHERGVEWLPERFRFAPYESSGGSNG